MKAVSTLIKNTPVALTGLFLIGWVIRQADLATLKASITASGIAMLATFMLIGIALRFRNRIAF